MEENHQKSLKLSQYAVETPIFAQVVEVATSSQKQAVSAQKTVIKGSFVASKSGKAYHLPWCSGAKRIKEENKIWFQTKEEAEKAGYHPAGNCEGL
jgi:methylphosphotriester-DNA--protein-cysteine methyltransferase